MKLLDDIREWGRRTDTSPAVGMTFKKLAADLRVRSTAAIRPR